MESYLADKKKDIDALRLIRLSLQTERAEMLERSANHERQRNIAAAIIDEQKPLQTAITGGNAADLFNRRLNRIRERSEYTLSRKRTLQEMLRDFTTSYSFEPTDVAMGLPLDVRLEEGSQDTRVLFETAVSAYVRSKRGSEYFPVGSYFPPLIFGLVNVGVLRLDPDRPDHACLALH